MQGDPQPFNLEWIYKAMKPSHFVHLHLHSQYSLLDVPFDLKRPSNWPKNMDGCHGTDRSWNMFGVVEFYQTAIKHGIKPIVDVKFMFLQGADLRKNRRGGEGIIISPFGQK